MKKLIITVAHRNASPTPLEYGFLLSDAAALPDYLERLREALFLTGADLQSAKVLDDDCGTEWLAPPDLVQRLNGAHLKQ